MLCPEVWNFKAPHATFASEQGDFDDTNIGDRVNSLCYNHLVSVVLPDTLKVPETIAGSLVRDCDYYRVAGLSLAEFVDKDFVESFVEKGKLTALSIDTRIDCEDCACITPNKKLILSLTKDSYQSLGLEGKLSHFCKNTKARYIITLDLTTLSPKTRQRAATRLQSLQKFNFIFTWEPPSEDICPSSIAKYFHDSKYNVKLCKPTHKARTEYSVNVPKVDVENLESEDAHSLLEWLGMLVLGCDLECSDAFLSSYDCPEPYEKTGQVKVLEWRGLFTATQINNLIGEIRTFIQSNQKQWAAIHVQGFSDAPINWCENEHHFYTNGDNSYILLLGPNNKYTVNLNKCSNKYYK